MLSIPDSLDWLRARDDGRAWLEALPGLLSGVLDDWGLGVAGPPFPGGTCGYVVPVSRAGQPLVLKLQWPHPEAEAEAAALAHWSGRGAVRLLAHDPARHALLLERCWPGDQLGGHVPDPLAAVARILRALSVPATGPFPTLAEEARRWAGDMPALWQSAGRPCPRATLDAALGAIADLVPTQPEQVLLHQDLHGHNILNAGARGWLAIDPKPLLGERAFALAPVIRSFEFGEGRRATLDRLDRLSLELRLDRDRARRWCIAQTVAWSFDSRWAERHYRTAGWLIDAA